MTGTTTGDRAAVRKLLADIEGDREKRRQSRYQATQRQVAAAIDALNQDDDAFRHMPWGALDELVGGIAPATLWYVVPWLGRFNSNSDEEEPEEDRQPQDDSRGASSRR